MVCLGPECVKDALAGSACRDVPHDSHAGAQRVAGEIGQGQILDLDDLEAFRIGTGADVAGAATFFASADGAFCNGSVLLVDGGMRAALRASSAARERGRR